MIYLYIYLFHVSYCYCTYILQNSFELSVLELISNVSICFYLPVSDSLT